LGKKKIRNPRGLHVPANKSIRKRRDFFPAAAGSGFFNPTGYCTPLTGKAFCLIYQSL
jgi:hypothetical protein